MIQTKPLLSKYRLKIGPLRRDFNNLVGTWKNHPKSLPHRPPPQKYRQRRGQACLQAALLLHFPRQRSHPNSTTSLTAREFYMRNHERQSLAKQKGVGRVKSSTGKTLLNFYRLEDSGKQSSKYLPIVIRNNRQ